MYRSYISHFPPYTGTRRTDLPRRMSYAKPYVKE